MEVSSLKKYIPNLVTSSRLLFLYFIIWFLVHDKFYFPVGIHIITNYHIIAALYFCGAMSDIVDGALARRWHVESSLGDTLDHLIDKVFVLPGGYILFKHLLGIPFGILAGLELITIVIGIRVYFQRNKGIKTKKFPNIFGKVAYGFLIGALCVTLVSVKWTPYWSTFRCVVNACLLIAISLRTVSLVKYFWTKS